MGGGGGCRWGLFVCVCVCVCVQCAMCMQVHPSGGQTYPSPPGGPVYLPLTEAAGLQNALWRTAASARGGRPLTAPSPPSPPPSPQRQLASERIDALVEDRRIREGEEAAHRTNVNQQLEQAAQKLKRTEEMLRHATKDAILGEGGGGKAEAEADRGDAAPRDQGRNPRCGTMCEGGGGVHHTSWGHPCTQGNLSILPSCAAQREMLQQGEEK